jgi:lipopolysaccharide biosynthesis glycosyltransferase
MRDVGDTPNARWPTACVAYTTDNGYLFPTLLSALQARQHTSRFKTDIFICYLGEPTRDSETVRGICAREGVIFRDVAPAEVDNMPIMYARLFLDDICGTRYEQILYMDGDTQVGGDLQALLDTPIPTGMLLSVRDPMTLVIDRNSPTWRRQREYLKSIGIDGRHKDTYFNSGVIYFKTDDWGDIRERCLALRRERASEFRFPDQDILNLTTRGRHLTMSFKWNFPIYFLNHAGVESLINPRIYHFMSNPRPWHGAFQPWGRDKFKKYDELGEAYPELRSMRKSLPQWLYWKYALQQRYKRVAENLQWRPGEFMSRVSSVEREAFV